MKKNVKIWFRIEAFASGSISLSSLLTVPTEALAKVGCATVVDGVKVQLASLTT